MNNEMQDKFEIIRNILSSKLIAPFWKRYPNGTYSVHLKYNDSVELLDITITDDDLSRVDLRLPEVVECMAKVNIEGMISNRRLAMTVLSHWEHKNHELLVLPHDGFNVMTKASQPETRWFIHALKRADYLKQSDDIVHIVAACYRVATTPNGYEYVIDRADLKFNRPILWLNDHVHDGAKLFNILEQIGITSNERGAYLQKNYMPVRAPDTIIYPKIDLDFDI